MKHFRLMMLAMFALLAIGAVSSTAAMAESDGPPAILVLEGKVTALKFEGNEATQKTVLSTKAKEISGEGLSATLSGCTELEKKEKDTNSCSTGLLTFTKTKQATTACRSENEAGTKDAVETILVKVSTKLGAEKSTAGVLQPLIVLSVFGVDGGVLTINCGAVKEKVKGQIGCLLLPGLTEIELTVKIEVLCKTKEKGVQETGTCEETKALCEELAKNPLLASLDGTNFETAAQTAHLNLTISAMLFIDD